MTNSFLTERDPLGYRRWPAWAQHPCVAVQNHDTCRDSSPRVTYFDCERSTLVPLYRPATPVASLLLVAPAPLDLCREGLAMSGWSYQVSSEAQFARPHHSPTLLPWCNGTLSMFQCFQGSNTVCYMFKASKIANFVRVVDWLSASKPLVF